MKWRVQLTYFVTISAQMVALFLAWWFKLLVDDSGPMIIALAVAALGITGGTVAAVIKRGAYSENPVIFWCVNILGSAVVTVGVFLVFVPVMGFLFHGSGAAIIFWFGFLAPLFIPYLINRIGVSKNA